MAEEAAAKEAAAKESADKELAAKEVAAKFDDKTCQMFIKKDLKQKDVSISEECYKFYEYFLMPVGNKQLFHKYYPDLTYADFYLKPMILLIGQYSTGKTTFIKYLMGSTQTPFLNIGPVPTTDKFNLIGYSDDEPISVQGPILIANNKLPFHQLSNFSDQLSNKLEAKGFQSAVTEKLIIVDTPGIKSGQTSLNPGNESKEKGSYSPHVVEWLADRSDRIIIFFDVLKLDITEELALVIKLLRKFDEKIIIVLNKLDLISKKEFIEVLSNFMITLGKLLGVPKPPEVFYTCFEEKTKNSECKKLYEESNQMLLKNLRDLTITSNVMKLNNLIKRTKLAKYHLLIVDQIARKFKSGLFTKNTDNVNKIIILEEIYQQLCKQDYGVTKSDLPDPEEFLNKMKDQDIEKYKIIDLGVIEVVEQELYDLILKIDPKILHEQHKMIKAKDYVNFPHYRKSISIPNPTPPSSPSKSRKNRESSNIEKYNSSMKKLSQTKVKRKYCSPS